MGYGRHSQVLRNNSGDLFFALSAFLRAQSGILRFDVSHPHKCSSSENYFSQLLTSNFNDAAGAALALSVLKQECCNSQEGLRNVRSVGGGFSAEKSFPSVSFEERLCSASKPSLI